MFACNVLRNDKTGKRFTCQTTFGCLTNNIWWFSQGLTSFILNLSDMQHAGGVAGTI